MTAADLEAARRDSVSAHGQYSAAISFDGAPATDEIQVVAVLHSAFPTLRFAASDLQVEDVDSGLWLVPLPRTVALIIDHGGHFDWEDIVWLHRHTLSTELGITIESSL